MSGTAGQYLAVTPAYCCQNSGVDVPEVPMKTGGSGDAWYGERLGGAGSGLLRNVRVSVGGSEFLRGNATRPGYEREGLRRDDVDDDEYCEGCWVYGALE